MNGKASKEALSKEIEPLSRKTRTRIRKHVIRLSQKRGGQPSKMGKDIFHAPARRKVRPRARPNLTKSSVKKNTTLLPRSYKLSTNGYGHYNITQAFTKKQYKSISKPSTNNGRIFGSSEAVYREFMKDGARCTEITCHMLLCSLNLGSPLSEGERFPDGISLLSVNALGAQLAVLSQQYQSYKIKEIELHYVPSVSTVTDGAILIYFQNDMATNLIIRGDEELRHAATAPSCISTPVWQECHLKIKPTEMMKRYWTDPTEVDATVESMGLIQVISASSLSAQAYGKLYCTVECEFEMPILSNSVDLGDTTVATLTIQSGTAWTKNDVVYYQDLGGSNVTFSNALKAQNAIVYGAVTDVTGSGSFPTYYTGDRTSPTSLAAGMGIFIRKYYIDGDSVYGIFSDYSAAKKAGLVSSKKPIITEGTLLYGNSGTASSDLVYSIACKVIYLDDDD